MSFRAAKSTELAAYTTANASESGGGTEPGAAGTDGGDTTNTAATGTGTSPTNKNDDGLVTVFDGYEVIIEGPSFVRALKTLLWKDYQQFYMRRRRLFVCRIFCPVLLILLLAVFRLTFQAEQIDPIIPNVNEDYEWFPGDIDFSTVPPSSDINDFIWLFCSDTGDSGGDPLALAIIPSPDDCGDLNDDECAHFRSLIDILNKTWTVYDEEEFYSSDYAVAYYRSYYVYCIYYGSSGTLFRQFLSRGWCEEQDVIEMWSLNETQTIDWLDLFMTWDRGCYDVVTKLPFEEGLLLRYFDSNSELDDYVTHEGYGTDYSVLDQVGDDGYERRPIAAAIVFNGVSEDGLQWDYTIRMNRSKTPSTSQVVNFLQNDAYELFRSSGVEGYIEEEFSNLQAWVDRSISYYIGEMTGKSDSPYGTTIINATENYCGGSGYYNYRNCEWARFNNILALEDQLYLYIWPFPIGSFSYDYFWSFAQYIFIVFVLVMFIYPINLNVSALVDEKACRITESLKMMGSSKTAYWLSWIIWFAFEQTLIAMGIALLGSWLGLFKYSDTGVLFVWMWGFCLSLSGFATLISTMFDNPKVASLVAIFVWILSLLSGYFAAGWDSSRKGWFCLLAPACLNMSLTNLVQYENNVLGVHPYNWHEEYDNFAFSTAVAMFWVDYVVYLVLALYLDRVWPSRYGARVLPWFCCLPSFWTEGRRSEGSELAEGLKQSNADYGKDIYVGDTFEDIRQQYNGVQPSIRIRDLRKHYFGSVLEGKNRVVKAVNGIDLDIYEGEVFCLLGHNGAGKTTTVDMLSGMTSVTSGEAVIKGHNVMTGINEIRKSLGVCPQHNILFPKLTVEQHLYLYCSLKGITKNQVQSEVQKTIDKIGLRDKDRAFPGELSGGQKRKLALGIAFIGDSKILFLDEPTAGMDPQARRVIWDLISKEKKNRTIILTTHFMDEADHLGDRIAIMSNGKVHCCGSPLFLKRVYGVGYTFTVSLNIGIKYEDVKAPMDSIVERHVEESQMLSVAGGEVNYRLPFQNSAEFAPMFEEFDNLQVNGTTPVNSYGISVTTLEEVFLKIGLAEHSDADALKPKAEYDPATLSEPGSAQPSTQVKSKDEDDPFAQPEFKLGLGHDASVVQRVIYEVYVFFLHAWCVLYRRFWWLVRDFRSILCQVVMPCIIATVGMAVIDLVVEEENPLLKLDVTQWHDVEHVKAPFANTSMGSFNYSLTDMQFDLEEQWQYNQTNYMFEDYKAWVVDGYESVMADEFGDLRYYEIDSEWMFVNGTYFPELLLDDWKDHKYAPYHAFYANPYFKNYIGIGFNFSAYHSIPTARNVMRNWILKAHLDADASIKTSNWPLKQTITEDAYDSTTGGLFGTIFLLMAVSFIPVGTVYQIVFERSESNTKHQQFISGMSMMSYWLGNYIADVLSASPAVGGLLIIVDAFGTSHFSGFQAMRALILSVYLFVWDVMPYTYILSFLFREPSTAQRWVGIIYIVIGLILHVLYVNVVTENKDLWYWLFSLFPPFSFSLSVYDIATKPDNKGYLDYGVCGKHLEFMFGLGFLWIALVLLIEYVSHSPAILMKLGLIPNAGKRTLELDVDVARERWRIEKMVEEGDQSNMDTVTIAGLRKVYQQGSVCGNGAQNVAVRDLWFGVPQGQVFGFLGVNGAGKTSALAMLTGERYPSEGIAYINGYPITNQSIVRRFIGYCPQFDALFDLLTAEEHLYFYGKLKGLSRKQIKEQTEILLKVLNLTKYRKKQSHTYSGGNKRKLSVAISMIGNPPVVFLDEPSTGMDPVSRRQMWDFISDTMGGRSVVLTTHSMEECQALCHRLAIMVKGQLKCIGTPQHLKTRFGNGYQFDVTLRDANDETRLSVENALSQTFDFKLLETNLEKVAYELEVRDEYIARNGKFTLASLFKELERLKQTQPIVTYAVNQTTLEQVFLRMAKAKADELESQLGKTEREVDRLKAELKAVKAENEILKAAKSENEVLKALLRANGIFYEDAQPPPVAAPVASDQTGSLLTYS